MFGSVWRIVKASSSSLWSESVMDDLCQGWIAFLIAGCFEELHAQ